VKAVIFKYLITLCLLLSLSESNGIPVISGFFVQTSQHKQKDDDCAESPANQAELIKAESVKDYLHQTFAFYFHSPVFTVPVKRCVVSNSTLGRAFYPDVLTPPPNC